MQIDFGERRVWIAGEQVTVHFLAAVLCYSRRTCSSRERASRTGRAPRGKTESGVKYVKRNAIAGRQFESFAHLEAHLAEWHTASRTDSSATTSRRS